MEIGLRPEWKEKGKALIIYYAVVAGSFMAIGWFLYQQERWVPVLLSTLAISFAAGETLTKWKKKMLERAGEDNHAKEKEHMDQGRAESAPPETQGKAGRKETESPEKAASGAEANGS